MLKTPAICGAQTEHPTSVLALQSPAPQLRFVLPAPPSDCSSSSSMGSLDDGTSPGTPAFAAGLPSRSMLPPSQSPAEAQRTQQGMCFDALLAVAQLAQAHQAMREEVGETREIAAARTRHLSGSAGAVPQPCSSMPTRLPRAVIECGVSRVLQTLPEEDQQQLHDARAFLAAI